MDLPIEVTKEDIAADTQSSPLFLAIQRSARNNEVRTTTSGVLVDQGCIHVAIVGERIAAGPWFEFRRYSALMPRSVETFIRACDTGKLVRPFSFNLKLTESEQRGRCLGLSISKSDLGAEWPLKSAVEGCLREVGLSALKVGFRYDTISLLDEEYFDLRIYYCPMDVTDFNHACATIKTSQRRAGLALPEMFFIHDPTPDR